MEHSEDDGHDHSRPTKFQIDSILQANITPKVEADKFGKMVIQDFDGRMKPVNTYASELLRKLSKHDEYEDFDANQVFLSLHESPFLWYNVQIVYLKTKKADTIRKLIGIPLTQKNATLADLFLKCGCNKVSPFWK